VPSPHAGRAGGPGGVSAAKAAPAEGVALVHTRADGKRTVKVTAGVAGGGPELVAETDRSDKNPLGVACMRSVCLGGPTRGVSCEHAKAGREYLDALDEMMAADSMAHATPERAA